MNRIWTAVPDTGFSGLDLRKTRNDTRTGTDTWGWQVAPHAISYSVMLWHIYLHWIPLHLYMCHDFSGVFVHPKSIGVHWTWYWGSFQRALFKFKMYQLLLGNPVHISVSSMRFRASHGKLCISQSHIFSGQLLDHNLHSINKQVLPVKLFTALSIRVGRTS